ncbi:MAG: hypothetical protein ACJAT8_000479 [Cellvibrionaceae bacterium]|jgi:hypothetical protein|tara:strand:+ start:2723 stop:2920 length:198 start_codon:yes stop_codon:yes gene_type:complete
MLLALKLGEQYVNGKTIDRIYPKLANKRLNELQQLNSNISKIAKLIILILIQCIKVLSKMKDNTK